MAEVVSMVAGEAASAGAGADVHVPQSIEVIENVGLVFIITSIVYILYNELP
jgi:hypothetical protein